MSQDARTAKEDIKTIREHVARAKAYSSRLDVVKTLDALVDALDLFTVTQIVGREKFEVTILIDEVLRTLSAMPQLKSLFPNGITLAKGQEKQILSKLSAVRDRIKAAIERAEYEKTYAYKVSIDQALIEAQRLVKEGQLDQARIAFRKVADKFVTEPGLLQDVGARMLRSGLVQESIDFLEQAIKSDPKDVRPYGHLVMALEGLGEIERALEVTKDALRNFGPNDRTYTIMARLHVKLKQWDEAFDMAKAAMDLNPFAAEAEKIAEKVKPRIFGKAEDGKTQEKKTYTFNI